MQLTGWYLWIKALHVAFMVTWFAGLFYLPRLFIYHTQSTSNEDRARFDSMERRLFAIMTIGAVFTTFFGAMLLWINSALLNQEWFQIKCVFLVGLIVYHFHCWQWIDRLSRGQVPEGTTWLRWFNEIPVVFLFGIIFLAIVKPF